MHRSHSVNSKAARVHQTLLERDQKREYTKTQWLQQVGKVQIEPSAIEQQIAGNLQKYAPNKQNPWAGVLRSKRAATISKGSGLRPATAREARSGCKPEWLIKREAILPPRLLTSLAGENDPEDALGSPSKSALGRTRSQPSMMKRLVSKEQVDPSVSTSSQNGVLETGTQSPRRHARCLSDEGTLSSPSSPHTSRKVQFATVEPELATRSDRRLAPVKDKEPQLAGTEIEKQKQKGETKSITECADPVLSSNTDAHEPPSPEESVTLRATTSAAIPSEGPITPRDLAEIQRDHASTTSPASPAHELAGHRGVSVVVPSLGTSPLADSAPLQETDDSCYEETEDDGSGVNQYDQELSRSKSHRKEKKSHRHHHHHHHHHKSSKTNAPSSARSGGSRKKTTSRKSRTTNEANSAVKSTSVKELSTEEFLERVITCQAYVRRYLAMALRAKMLMHKKKSDRRIQITQEVLKVESTFISDMGALMAIYIRPLAKLAQEKNCHRGVLALSGQLPQLENDITVILNYNNMILRDLRGRLGGWNEDSKLGDIFFKISQFLKTYTTYVDHYSGIQEIFSVYKEDRQFQNILRGLIVDDENRSMKDFLIMPVQHIPRLQLLLRDLLKSTWRSHPDFENLEKASNTLSETVSYIENATVRNANVNQVREIAASLMGRRVAQLQLVVPHRVLVKQAVVRGVVNRTERDFQIYLFNDMILFTRERADRKGGPSMYRLEKAIPMCDCETIDIVDYQGASGVVIRTMKGSESAMLVPPEEDKDTWEQLLLEAQKYAWKHPRKVLDESDVMVPITAGSRKGTSSFSLFKKKGASLSSSSKQSRELSPRTRSNKDLSPRGRAQSELKKSSSKEEAKSERRGGRFGSLNLKAKPKDWGGSLGSIFSGKRSPREGSDSSDEGSGDVVIPASPAAEPAEQTLEVDI